jgi:hypothetical protein
LAKNLAKAATSTGLLKSLIKAKISEVNIASPFRWDIFRAALIEKINREFSVDNNVQGVTSSVMSQDHESLENLLSEEREFPPTAEFAARRQCTSRSLRPC